MYALQPPRSTVKSNRCFFKSCCNDFLIINPPLYSLSSLPPHSRRTDIPPRPSRNPVLQQLLPGRRRLGYSQTPCASTPLADLGESGGAVEGQLGPARSLADALLLLQVGRVVGRS